MDPTKEATKATQNQTQVATKNLTRQKDYKPHYSLLGDVGGTNFRLQLVLVQPPHNEPVQIVKQHKYLVKNEDNFLQTIKKFLADVPSQKYPYIAVIGVAGPVQDNKVSLSNVSKWGELNGQSLGQSLKISHFVFLNDFIAVSFGLLLLPEDNFISLNGLKINPKNTRGVLGPGTGLGNSIIYSSPFRKRQRTYVLPSEGGHCDTPWINDLTAQYYKFLCQKLGINYVGLEYSFCGPAIPYMYQFFGEKNPTYEGANTKTTSEQIIQTYNSNREADTLERKTVEFFLDLYSSAICNYIIAHMCTGGLYLVGSLTNAVIQTLKQTNLTKKFDERHPEMTKLLHKVPIVVSKQVDLGLKGAYVYARRIIADQQHD